MNSSPLRITEIFYSLQGEARHVGLPTVFVRLTGCPMRCTYCDSAYAFTGGDKRQLSDILADVAQYDAKYITVTGGEPLAQPQCHALLTALCDQGYTVSLETGNAIDISHVDDRVHIVLDIKTPASAEEHNNRYQNLEHIQNKDQLKFVLVDRADYDWSKQFVQQRNLTDKVEILFSPAADLLSPTDLANWIVEDRLAVRFQIQLHKQLWGDVPGV